MYATTTEGDAHTAARLIKGELDPHRAGAAPWTPDVVSGLTISYLVDLAHAAMGGRREAIDEAARNVVAALAYDLGGDEVVWQWRFSVRHQPGGATHVEDILELIRAAANSRFSGFAAQWRVVFDDALNPATCDVCGAAATRVHRANGWIKLACDTCTPETPLIEPHLGAIPS
jgi:hypothetical protein